MRRLTYTPPDPTALLTAFQDAITSNVPVIIGVFGAVIGIVFLVVIGNFVLKRVRGSVH